jgi:hypothetical protein
MSPQQDPELFLRLWLDPFDIFPQHFQPQPVSDSVPAITDAVSQLANQMPPGPLH